MIILTTAAVVTGAVATWYRKKFKVSKGQPSPLEHTKDGPGNESGTGVPVFEDRNPAGSLNQRIP